MDAMKAYLEEEKEIDLDSILEIIKMYKLFKMTLLSNQKIRKRFVFFS